MDDKQLEEYEASFIDQFNCPLNFDFVIDTPPKNKKGKPIGGNNVLHFNSTNRTLTTGSKQFVEDYLSDAQICQSESQVLQYAVNEARRLNPEKERGIFLEVGFCTGRTLNFIAALGFDRTVYGFDSGNGLPYAWEGKEEAFPIGRFRYTKKFAIEGKNMILKPRGTNEANAFIPFTPLPNVKLVMGEIGESLSKFVEYIEKKKYSIDFIHIDTDIRQSCKSIYKHLKQLIKPNKTVIVLDEGFNYRNDITSEEIWKNHEIKETEKFAKSNALHIDYIAYNEFHQQVALIFTK